MAHFQPPDICVYIYIYIYIYIYREREREVAAAFATVWWIPPDSCKGVGVKAARSGSARTKMGCDIHTHAHAQDSLYNMCVEEMGTVGCL